jgi:hypothetical protein
MTNATMSFKLTNDGMKLKKTNIVRDLQKQLPLSTSYIVDIPKIMESIKKKKDYVKNFKFLEHKAFSFVPAPILATTINIGSTGIFWKAFLVYIFPWMLDIAKVYCCIRICQAFYEERRGGRDSGTGFGAVVQYGKWYLIFWLIPWAVELIDQIGGHMFNDLQNKGVNLDDAPTFKTSDGQ